MRGVWCFYLQWKSDVLVDKLDLDLDFFGKKCGFFCINSPCSVVFSFSSTILVNNRANDYKLKQKLLTSRENFHKPGALKYLMMILFPLSE